MPSPAPTLLCVERYDNGTRVWTTVFGIAIAAVIDWLAVVNPARGYTPVDPHKGWWVFALALICVAPASWFIGRLMDRQYTYAIIWFFVLAAIVVAQFVPLTWAQDQL
jgi:hypothetical protein